MLLSPLRSPFHLLLPLLVAVPVCVQAVFPDGCTPVDGAMGRELRCWEPGTRNLTTITEEVTCIRGVNWKTPFVVSPSHARLKRVVLEHSAVTCDDIRRPTAVQIYINGKLCENKIPDSAATSASLFSTHISSMLTALKATTTPLSSSSPALKNTSTSRGFLNDRLSKIPWDVLDEMKGLALCASWHAANHLKGYDNDAESDSMDADLHSEKIGQFHLLRGDSLRLYSSMCWSAAWSTANARMGTPENTAVHKETVLISRRALVSSGQVTEGLAHDLEEMCWATAWHTANTRKGYYGDAAKDKERSERFYKRCGGDVRLVAVDFLNDRAEQKGEKVLMRTEQVLKNWSDEEQDTSATVSYQKVTTRSWGKVNRWEHGATGGVKVAFFTAGISATFSYTAENGGSFTDEEETQVTVKAKVGPRSSVKVTGVIQERTYDIPYVKTYEIGRNKYHKTGVWSGVLGTIVSSEFGKSVPLE